MKSLVVLGAAVLGSTILAGYQGSAGTSCASARDAWKPICRGEQLMADDPAPVRLIEKPQDEVSTVSEHEAKAVPQKTLVVLPLPKQNSQTGANGGSSRDFRAKRKRDVRAPQVASARPTGSVRNLSYSRQQVSRQAIPASQRKVASTGRPKFRLARRNFDDRHASTATVLPPEAGQILHVSRPPEGWN